MHGTAIPPRRLRQFYHHHDKVVTLLDKIRNTRHVDRLMAPPHWGRIWAATSQIITPAALRQETNRGMYASTGA
jgi:hypothetical protein